MSIAVGFTYETGHTLYAIRRNATGQCWTGAAYETQVNANWGTYDIALSESPASGRFYSASIASLLDGAGSITVYRQLGGSPAHTDLVVGGPQELVVSDDAEVVLGLDWADDGRLDAIVDAIKAKTDNLPVSPAAVGSAMTLADSEDVYHADVFLTRDTLNVRDEYTVVWYKNGTPVTSGITLPTIQVVKRVNGTNLIAAAAMTQIGATGQYKYDSSTLLTSGEAGVAVVQATIDGVARVWRRVVGRDI